MKPTRFMRQPFYVDAVQVSRENLLDVAEWCQGEVRSTPTTPGEPSKTYIHVRVLRPLNERQTQAFVGDYILYAGTGYKIYTAAAFKRTFIPVKKEDIADFTEFVTELQQEAQDDPGRFPLPTQPTKRAQLRAV